MDTWSRTITGIKNGGTRAAWQLALAVWMLMLVTPTALAQPQPATTPPVTPVIDDPMLAPVPEPPRIIRSWRQALDLMRTRSTDMRQALDQVLLAESRTRIAVAAYLPSVTGTLVADHEFLTSTTPASPQTVATWVDSNGQPVRPLLNGAPSSVNGAPGLLLAPASPTTTIPATNYLTATLTAQQALVNMAAWDDISVNELGEKAAELSAEDVKRTLALSLANSIVAVIAAEQEAEVNRLGLRVALEQLALTRKRMDMGGATRLDVVRAQQNVANARATLVTGDEALREAREALGLALGVPEETGVASGVDVGTMASDAIAMCKAVSSVDERPDIQAARERLELAKRQLRNVYYTFLPTLAVQSTFATTGQQLYFGFPNTTWNIQGVLTVPIWDGGVRYGTLRGARAAEDVARQQLEAQRRQAIVQVEQARRMLTAAQDSERIAEEQRDVADENDRLTQLAFQTGQGTSLELVTASASHRQAELNLVLRQFGVTKARLLATLALATCPD